MQLSLMPLINGLILIVEVKKCIRGTLCALLNFYIYFRFIHLRNIRLPQQFSQED